MGISSSSSASIITTNNNNNHQILFAPPQNGNTSKNASTFFVFSSESTKFLLSGYSDGTMALYELNSASLLSFTKVSNSKIVAIQQMIVSKPSSTNKSNNTFFFVCLSHQPPQLHFVKLEITKTPNESDTQIIPRSRCSLTKIPSPHLPSLFSLCNSNNFTNSTKFASCLCVVHHNQTSTTTENANISIVVGGNDGSICCVGQEEENFCPTVKMFMDDEVVGTVSLPEESNSLNQKQTTATTFAAVSKNSEKMVFFDFIDHSHDHQEEGKTVKIPSEIIVKQELQVPGMRDVIGMISASNDRKKLVIISRHELFVVNNMKIASRIPLVVQKDENVTSFSTSSATNSDLIVVTNKGELLKINLENSPKLERLTSVKRIPSNFVASIVENEKNRFLFIESDSAFISALNLDDENKQVKIEKTTSPSNIDGTKIRQSFDFFDCDGSGFLEKTEALAAFAHLAQKYQQQQSSNLSPTRRSKGAREIFDEADWNKDGKLSFAEFKKAIMVNM